MVISRLNSQSYPNKKLPKIKRLTKTSSAITIELVEATPLVMQNS